MDPRQTPVGHSLNVSGEHLDRDAQLAAYSGHHDGDSGTTEHNETFSRESSCTLTAEDDEQAENQQAMNEQAENEQAKSMPTTMEAESVALIDRIKNDPFHTPMLLSEAKRILDCQLKSTEDKALSFLDKDPTTAPFVYDMVHSMDMREDVFAFQELMSHDMSRRKWYTVEAFSKPLSLAALFLAKHVTADRKLPVEVMKKLQAREQREIARWVEHSGVLHSRKIWHVSRRATLFVHAGYDGYHLRHHYDVLKDPRPLVESGYEFDHGPSEPWGSIAHMITAYSKEAKRRSELVPAYPVVPEVADNGINYDPSRAYVDVGDNATLAVEGETYWHEGRRWPPNVDANSSSPGRATDTGFEFLGEDKDAAFTDALLMNMLG
ncbi:hypothetical protein PG988_004582 [Apiospora saccharicola]